MAVMMRAPEPAPLRACTVSRDVQAFEFLIDDMEKVLGEAWGDLTFADALLYLDQPDADALEALVLAVSDADVEDIQKVESLIKRAREQEIGVILVAADLDPVALHRLMRSGANEFLPYPVPEGGLEDAMKKLSAPPPAPPQAAPVAESHAQGHKPRAGSGPGRIFAVQGLAGGVGATVLAVNLAWELAASQSDSPRVALVDFDLQFGAIGTYLDLPRRDAVFEMLSDTANADGDVLVEAMLDFGGRLSVLTSPADVIPLDLIGPEDVSKLLDLLQARFDYIVIDMPRTLVAWSETVLHRAETYLPVVELDMRSAQNTLRLLKTLKGEDLPVEKLRFVLNRAPRFTDITGRSRLKRMAESLDIKIEDMLSDGGRHVAEATDQGQPLGEAAAKNPLRKDVQKLAASLVQATQTTSAAASKRA